MCLIETMSEIDFQYKAWDTHAYSQDFRAILAHRGLHFALDPTAEAFDAAIAEIKALLSSKWPEEQDRTAQPSWVAVLKMEARQAAGNYIDQDLGGEHVGAILVATWQLVREADVDELFIETLADIGDTCIQGDSHRLLALYLALTETDVEVIPNPVNQELPECED